MPAGRRRPRGRPRRRRTPSPWLAVNPSTGGSCACRRSPAPVAMAWPIGCSEACSTAPPSRSTSATSTSSAAIDVDQLHLAGGHRAGLVQHDGVDDPGRLQHLRPLDQHPIWAPRPVPTSSAVGVARPSAHGHAMISTATAAVNAAVTLCPVSSHPASVASDEGDDDRYEHRRTPGRRDAGPAPSRSARPRPAAPSGRAGCRPPPGWRARPAGRRRSRSRRPRCPRDRPRPGRARRSASRRRPRTCRRLHDAVGGDLLAGADDEHVTDRELADRDPHLVGPVPEHGDVLGAHVRAAPAGPRRTAAWRGPRSSGRPG